MSRDRQTRQSGSASFPRASGDEPKLLPPLRERDVFSPRERG